MLTDKTAYQPVSCSFYDYLEHFATLRKVITVAYLENGKLVQLENQIIRDLSGGRKGEYVHLHVNGNEKLIRADHLIAVDGIKLTDFPSDTCTTK